MSAATIKAQHAENVAQLRINAVQIGRNVRLLRWFGFLPMRELRSAHARLLSADLRLRSADDNMMAVLREVEA